MFRRFMCWLGRCTRCEPILDSPFGIGEHCIDCGKVHVWVTREELRRHIERAVETKTPLGRTGGAL